MKCSKPRPSRLHLHAEVKRFGSCFKRRCPRDRRGCRRRAMALPRVMLPAFKLAARTVIGCRRSLATVKRSSTPVFVSRVRLQKTFDTHATLDAGTASGVSPSCGTSAICDPEIPIAQHSTSGAAVRERFQPARSHLIPEIQAVSVRAELRLPLDRIHSSRELFPKLAPCGHNPRPIASGCLTR